MPKIWDYCKTCGKPLLRQFHDCKSCRIINLAISSFTVFSAILVVFLGIYYCTRHWLGLIGLILDIFGAYWLATGYLEAMVQAASGGGGGGEVIMGLKKKHAPKIWGGLIFLIFGFLLQAINSL